MTSNERTQITGSCLCNNVKYKIDGGSLDSGFLCHCTNCQKSTGSAFVANFFCQKSQFSLLSGSDLVRVYIANNVRRSFCGECGTSLFNSSDDEEDPVRRDVMTVSSGTLDEDFREAFKPGLELFCTRRRTWLPALSGEGVKQCDGMPDL